MDTIHIRDLSLRTIIGIFPEERHEKQDVVFNIELRCDMRKAGESDDLADAIDYKSVKKKIIDLVEHSQFNLIEKLATAVADLCLDVEGVQEIRVVLDKPNALRFARSVAVDITRSR